MANRITDSMLDSKVRVINAYLNQPAEHYSAPGKANVGHYYLSYQSGCISLYQAGEHGDRNIFIGSTKAETYGLLDAFIRGLQDAKEIFCKG